MKIVINAITANGMDISEEMDASDLGIETEQVSYKERVIVKVHAEKDKHVVSVNCSIRGKRRQTCGGCLSDFESPIDKNVDFVYKLTGDHIILLDADIKDTIILDYPIRSFCSEGCKGLCVQCGKNLNEGPCECEDSSKVKKFKS
ncbi:MAG: DUF177 domain-containing protein [Candidatus Omnitrophota bacterium]